MYNKGVESNMSEYASSKICTKDKETNDSNIISSVDKYNLSKTTNEIWGDNNNDSVVFFPANTSKRNNRFFVNLNKK